jgi:ApaG protein
MSSAVTNGIRIEVVSSYMPEKSQPLRSYFFFTYNIRITNEGHEPVTLISRHWKIRDAMGSMHVVNGEGVVGEQPRIMPGDSFSYTSFCPLHTEFGMMEGYYTMQYDDNTSFDAMIAPFRLMVPESLN